MKEKENERNQIDDLKTEILHLKLSYEKVFKDKEAQRNEIQDLNKQQILLIASNE